MAGRIGNIFLKNAVAAYSLRRLTPKYTGNVVRVRRDSDNSEIDIGFTENGELNTSTLLSFVGVGNGFVTIWYDQSGNGVDQFRSISNQQPQIVTNGTIYTSNEKPALYFNGNMSMRSVTNVSLTSPDGEWSSFGVVQPTGGFDISRVILSYDGVTGNFTIPRIGQFMRFGPPSNPSYQAIGFRNDQASFNDSGPLQTLNQVILNSIRTTSTVEMFANGIGNGPTITTGVPSTGVTPLDIGYRGGINFSVFQPVSYIQELIHYNVDVICYYKNILNRINSYYKTF